MKDEIEIVPNSNVMKNDLEHFVYYATLAPSGHNTQPWKFKIDDDSISIYPDYSRRLPVVDSDNHALFISLGCALENVIIAADHKGYNASIEFQPTESKEHIKVRFTTHHHIPHDSRLYHSIEKRQVTRNKYTERQIPESDIQRLIDTSKQEGVQVKVFHKNGFKEIIPLIEEANLLQFNNKQFKNELMKWIRYSDKQAKKTNDGLKGTSMGYPSAPAWLGKLFFNLFDTPKKEAKNAIDLVRSSSLLLMFVALNNDKENWINIGRSYQRMALEATELGIKHAHVNMPCEELSVRKKLKEKFGLINEEPMLLIRLGYSGSLPKSLRRPVGEVMV